MGLECLHDASPPDGGFNSIALGASDIAYGGAKSKCPRKQSQSYMAFLRPEFKSLLASLLSYSVGGSSHKSIKTQVGHRLHFLRKEDQRISTQVLKPP